MRAGDGRAARHGLERREAEALVQRRQHIRVGGAVQRRQVVGADGPGEHRAVADAEGDGELGRPVPAPAEAAGDDELVRLGRPAGHEPGPGRHEPREVLARLEVAEREHVRRADAEGAEQAVRAVPAVVARGAEPVVRAVERPEAPVHALGRDEHALAAHAEQRAELVARVPRGHEHARRSRHRGAHPGVEHEEVAGGEPLRVAEKGDVVHRDDRRRAGRERRGVGGVDHLRAVLAGDAGEVERQARDVGAAGEHDAVVAPRRPRPARRRRPARAGRAP